MIGLRTVTRILLTGFLLVHFGCSKGKISTGRKGVATTAVAQGVRGAVEFRETDGEQWRTLTNEHLFLENTAIRNVSTGVVRLVFGPGFSTNALLPNTEIRLKRAARDATGNSDFQLQLERGGLAGGTTIATATTKYEVASRDGVLGVRSGPCEFLLNNQVAVLCAGTGVFVKIFRGAASAATIPPGTEIDIASMRVYATNLGTNSWMSEDLKGR
jgi:hypothetical protein